MAAGIRRYEKQIPLFLLIPALTILWGSLALAAVLWLNRSVGRHIVRPVQALAEDSRRIAENDYSGPPVSTECEDEIADLVRAFCRMKALLWRCTLYPLVFCLPFWKRSFSGAVCKKCGCPTGAGSRWG